ncbi:MAG: hypothetical protein Unbinned8472contig1000_29 [Prokaryotic dsDNA virus sp.]|nr:MAG: hypothetical protein Unbinned8472contig1000_29 [Prokaryotic dsDNA virus sp.]|tara:strand:- start:3473 stop:3934 length:462 start_codon:yes stop_codon:yes gene_type:complete
MSTKQFLLLCCVNLILGLAVSCSVKAGEVENPLPNYLVIGFDQRTAHFNEKDYYNNYEHQYLSVTVNNWTFANFENSFFESTQSVSYQWRQRYTNWMEGYISLMYLHGYSDMRNFITPTAGLRVGPKLGPQFEMNLLPGAVSWGYRFVFSDED